MKDFTLAKYRELLTELKEHYQISTVEEYFNNQDKDRPFDFPEGDKLTNKVWGLKPYKEKPFVVLRHDVDRRPHNALRMAELETAMGISSTYYFRKSTFNQDIIEDIHFWGHEIGYHYEVMDKAKGDIGVAHAIFNSEIEILRCWVPVKTCAAHGNPLTKYDNRTFFESFDPEQFGLVGQGDSIPMIYFTDTGRGNLQFNHKDKKIETLAWAGIKGLSAQAMGSCVINIHPERWNDGLAWYRQWLFDWGCNLVKRMIKR